MNEILNKELEPEFIIYEGEGDKFSVYVRLEDLEIPIFTHKITAWHTMVPGDSNCSYKKLSKDFYRALYLVVYELGTLPESRKQAEIFGKYVDRISKEERIFLRYVNSVIKHRLENEEDLKPFVCRLLAKAREEEEVK